MQGLILLDKTKDITSFGAVARIKHLCGEKRVGHTGTLDPLATGVLPVLIGKATALSGYMLDADKRYIATVKLGVTTDTEDITGEVIEEREVSVTQDRLEKTLQKFVGKLMQRPPMYSALKKDGIPMYERARRGEKIDIPEREITVHSLKVLESLSADNTFSFEASVSKGTYIRSLIRDIGEELGCGATMTELRRTETASIDISKCVSLDRLNFQNIKDYIINEENAVSYMREAFVSGAQAERFTNGGTLSLDRLKIAPNHNGELLRVKFKDKFLGIGRVDLDSKELKVECVINYPKLSNAIALGTFDGVHSAHKKVLDLPEKYKKIAVCFSLPPKTYFGNEARLLTDEQTKKAMLKNAGMDEVCSLEFSDFRDKTPMEFLLFLKEKFSPKVISCGYNYRFGKDAAGDIKLLEAFCKENEIKLICEKKVERGGKTVSSTAIRELLANGKIKEANSMLGYKFSFTAEVIGGDKRGRTLGFPTVNQRYPEELARLKNGVYKTRVVVKGEEYEGITNIGNRPTYLIDFIVSETYIKNFSEEIYGEKVTIIPISFLREEKKFANIEELKRQILLDLGE